MPKLRYDVPYWLQGAALAGKSAPRCTADIDADVIVVGGGLVGCLTACLLRAERYSVVLLEAQDIGGGVTSRATGLVAQLPDVSLAEVRAAIGLRAARHLFDAHRVARRDFQRVLTRLGVRDRWNLSEGLVVAGSDAEARFLKRDHDAAEELGLSPAWCPLPQAKRASGLDAVAALRCPATGLLNPVRLAAALAAACRRARVKVFERTPVEALTFGKEGVTATVPRAVVTARRVVIATGDPGDLFPALRRHFEYRETYAVVTEPLVARQRRALGQALVCRDLNQPPRTWGLAADHRLVIQGGEQGLTSDRDRQATVVQRTGQLMYELSRYYPEISGAQPVAGWSCPVTAARDGLAVVGTHRTYPHHVFALGLGRSGPAGALAAARLVVRHVQGSATTTDEVFGFHRG